MSLLAIVLNSLHWEHFYHHQQLYWTALSWRLWRDKQKEPGSLDSSEKQSHPTGSPAPTAYHLIFLQERNKPSYLYLTMQPNQYPNKYFFKINPFFIYVTRGSFCSPGRIFLRKCCLCWDRSSYSVYSKGTGLNSFHTVPGPKWLRWCERGSASPQMDLYVLTHRKWRSQFWDRKSKRWAMSYQLARTS